jgi:predicted transcriptional regulator
MELDLLLSGSPNLPPMPRPVPLPTEAELDLLSVLWGRGPATVRDVRQALGRDAGYTTVLKLLQIMTEKKLVVRDEAQRAHIYAASESEQRTQGRLIGDLMDRAFGGSPTKLVMQALSSSKATAADLTAIRQLIEQIEGESK